MSSKEVSSKEVSSKEISSKEVSSKEVNLETNKKLTCEFCEFRTTNLTKINLKSYCVLCRLTLKPTTQETHKLSAAYSIHPQFMINKLSREFILKYNRIPLPRDIDPNCREIEINPTLLHSILDLMSQDDRSCFVNIKYFLSDEIDIKEIKPQNFFRTSQPLNLGTSQQVKLETNKIPLLKHQKNLFDKYYLKFCENNRNNLINLFKVNKS